MILIFSFGVLGTSDGTDDDILGFKKNVWTYDAAMRPFNVKRACLVPFCPLI